MKLTASDVEWIKSHIASVAEFYGPSSGAIYDDLMEFTGAISVSISSSTRLGLNSPICSWFIGKRSSLLSRSSAFLDGMFLIETVQFLSMAVRQALTAHNSIDASTPSGRGEWIANEKTTWHRTARKLRFMHFNEIPFIDVTILKWTSSNRLELHEFMCQCLSWMTVACKMLHNT